MLKRIILFPIALLWGLVLWVRHVLYDAGVLPNLQPNIPSIVIGNLSLGGTGKTPHVRLVIESLIGLAPLATLSRGYGRSGTGFREVNANDTAASAGDEPLMIKRAHPEVRVFVGADRVRAIQQIEKMVPDVKAVILDDAFQHRRLSAHLNIVLTTWQRPWSVDALLPAGTLRDLKSRANAAQVVVVTKCPPNLLITTADPENAIHREWRHKLRLSESQHLYFSALQYAAPRGMNGNTAVTTGPGTSALLVTGIADPDPLLLHARATWEHVHHLAFRDHHNYTPADVVRLAALFATFAGRQKTILTTEKDAERLMPLIAGSALEHAPIAVVPVKAQILNHPERFDDLLRSHLATHRTNG